MIIIPTLGSIGLIILTLRTGINVIDIILLLGMYILTSLGITLGYHRYFAHHSFKTSTTIKVIFGILGSMSCQGPLIYWVASHRRHHRYSDISGDLHSPYINRNQPMGWWQGFYHSHMGWTYSHELTNSFLFAKDLVLDKTISTVNKYYYLWVLLGLIIPSIIEGIITWSWSGVLRGFLWGGLLRLFLVHHSSWTIGSIAHIYGSSPFSNHDNSKNNFWIALPTLGEGWHNNHHAFPNSAFHGLEWWQVDVTGLVIRTLQLLDLAWDVKRPSSSMIQAKTKTAQKV